MRLAGFALRQTTGPAEGRETGNDLGQPRRGLHGITQGIRRVAEELRSPSPRVVVGPTPEPAAERLLLGDVFKESGTPTATFVVPDSFPRLVSALRQPGRGIVIEGPSGIGKTTALRTAIKEVGADHVRYLSARRPEDVATVKRIVSGHEGTAAIDDFHRLDEALRNKIVDHMKYLADAELSQKLVIVGIPGTSKSLVDLSFDLATRIEVIRMAKVGDGTINAMIEKGEVALNVQFDRKADIIRESGGSLNIAQMLCHDIAAREGITQTQSKPALVHSDLEQATSDVMDTMRLKFGNVVNCFASLGRTDDRICIELLQELAHEADGILSLRDLGYRRPELASGIARFMKPTFLAPLAKRFPEYETFLLYDASRAALIIDDPQLAYYLNRLSYDLLRRDAGKSLATPSGSTL